MDTLILDDKDRLGGKLLLQTHKFFGSVEDSQAGTRGYEIARQLEQEVRGLASVEIWLNTTAAGGNISGMLPLSPHLHTERILPAL